ncbi:hypothetical protein PENSPDRAFT_544016, partial [Peniophora sp. CONT]
LRPLPSTLSIAAVTEEIGLIMGVWNRTLSSEVDQHYPESILSGSGNDLMHNILTMNGGTWAENPHAAVTEPDSMPFN